MSDAEDTAVTSLTAQLDALEGGVRSKVLQRLGVLSPMPGRSGDTGNVAAESRGISEGARIVVETNANSRPLRLFSGKTPTPAGEVDFQTWRILAQQKLDDSTLSDAAKKRTITQSLLRPALDTVRTSIKDANTDELFRILLDVYGDVADGQELYIRFLGLHQEAKETAGEYLQRLYLLALDVVEHQGMEFGQMLLNLLQQFCRGCPDEDLIQKLRLDELRDAPPSFPAFLLMIRKEESRRAEKRLRLRQPAHSKQVVVSEKTEETDTRGLVVQLQQQVAALERERQQWALPPPPQQQHHQQLQQHPHQGAQQPKGQQRSQQGQQWRGRGQRRKYFCYKCGLENHVKRDCQNQSNATLVQQKLLGLPDQPLN